MKKQANVHRYATKELIVAYGVGGNCTEADELSGSELGESRCSLLHPLRRGLIEESELLGRAPQDSQYARRAGGHGAAQDRVSKHPLPCGGRIDPDRAVRFAVRAARGGRAAAVRSLPDS